MANSTDSEDASAMLIGSLLFVGIAICALCWLLIYQWSAQRSLATSSLQGEMQRQLLSRQNLFWIVVGCLVIFCLLILWSQYSPILGALHYFYYGPEEFKKLFSQIAGLDDAPATLLGNVLAFIYAIAWLLVAKWIIRLAFGKVEFNKLVVVLPMYVILAGSAYGSASALIHVIFDNFGPTVCFDRQNGTPLKWYSIRPDGTVLLSNSPGYDPQTREQRIVVTPEICSIADHQKRGELPKIISFDQALGKGEKEGFWYRRTSNGIEVFDIAGIDLKTGGVLKLADANIRLELKKSIDNDRIAAAKKEKLERDEQARLDKLAADQQAAQQREQARLDKLAADQQAAQERAEQEELRTKRGAAIQQLAGLRQTSSSTEWDCAFDADGVYLAGQQNSQREMIPYSTARVAAERVNITANVFLMRMSIPVITVRIMGPSFERDVREQCLVYTISPAPAYASPDQIATINNVLDSLSVLGPQITQRYVPDNPPVIFGAPPLNGATFGGDVNPGGASSYSGTSSYTGSGYIGGRSYIGGGGRR